MSDHASADSLILEKPTKDYCSPFLLKLSFGTLFCCKLLLWSIAVPVRARGWQSWLFFEVPHIYTQAHMLVQMFSVSEFD